MQIPIDIYNWYLANLHHIQYRASISDNFQLRQNQNTYTYHSNYKCILDRA